MHGLVNRAIQSFITTGYGPEVWATVAREAGLGRCSFAAILNYSDATTEALLRAASTRLGLPEEMILEDLGTFLVTDPALDPLRRLMRFGGESFIDFLYSLEDLPERLRLIVPDFPVPALELTDGADQGFVLQICNGWSGFLPVLQGMLRAMADDYGALVLLESEAVGVDGGRLRISLLDTDFAAGRSFSLKGPAA